MLIIPYDYAENCFHEIAVWNATHQLTLQSGEKIFDQQPTCFHYTSLDSFWKIIESEVFRATHVRFSNDMEEYQLGERFIKQIVQKDLKNYDDYYVICFCYEEDLLSQWREYGKIGVSIGMDYSRKSVFSVIRNSNKREPTSTDRILFAMPTSVLYIDNKFENGSLIFLNSQKVTLSSLSEACSKPAIDYFDDKQMRNLIPHIKHNAFLEEKEARLLFTLSVDEEANYVFYKNPEPYRKPYLQLKYGNTAEKNIECKYVHVEGKESEELKPIIEKCTHQFCKRFNEVIEIKTSNDLSQKSTSVYISDGMHQQELFQIIDGACSSLCSDVQIWCDGHWPIRSIMVGPTSEKNLICESIKHYCKSIYWLKYVSVKATDTPYREKRE